MERNGGDEERLQAYYEEYVSKLVAQADKEREKDENAAANLAKLSDEWRVWVAVLSAATRKVQNMADAGDEGAQAVTSSNGWALGGSDGDAPEAGGGGPTTEARLATALVDVAAKSDSRLSALRKKIKELDVIEAETSEKLRKATEKINAHHALTAHRKAPATVGDLGAALKVAQGLKKKKPKGTTAKGGGLAKAAAAMADGGAAATSAGDGGGTTGSTHADSPSPPE